MILPFIILALGIGVIAAYEWSPKTHGWVDDHIKAMQSAWGSHQAADTHLAEAQAIMSQLPPPGSPTPAPTPVPVQPEQPTIAKRGMDYLESLWHAVLAHQDSVHSTVDAAKTAQTPAQKQAAVDSAAQVEARQPKIDAALKLLGVGECGLRSYSKVSPKIRDAIVAKLRGAGMEVTGTNPYSIDTHRFGVSLQALWNPATETIYVIVSKKPLVPTCNQVWDEIEPSLKSVISTGS